MSVSLGRLRLSILKKENNGGAMVLPGDFFLGGEV